MEQTKGSTRIPNNILLSDKLTDHEKVVWLKLRSLQDQGVPVFSLSRTARFLDTSPRGLQRTVKALAELGLVTKDEWDAYITRGLK